MIKFKRSTSSKSDLRKYSREFLQEKITGRERGVGDRGLAKGGKSYEEYFGGPRASNIFLAILGLPQSFQDLLTTGMNFIMGIFKVGGALFPELGNAGTLLQGFLAGVFTADTDRIAKNAMERSWGMRPGTLKEIESRTSETTSHASDPLTAAIGSSLSASPEEDVDIDEMILGGAVSPEDMFDEDEIPVEEEAVEEFVHNLIMWMDELSYKSYTLETMEIGDSIEEFILYVRGIDSLSSDQNIELDEIISKISFQNRAQATDIFVSRAANPVLGRMGELVVEGYLANAKNLTAEQQERIEISLAALRSDLSVF